MRWALFYLHFTETNIEVHSPQSSNKEHVLPHSVSIAICEIHVIISSFRERGNLTVIKNYVVAGKSYTFGTRSFWL